MATRTNLIPNPSFETGRALWRNYPTSPTMTTPAGDTVVGNRFLRTTMPGTVSPYLRVICDFTPDQPANFTAEVRARVRSSIDVPVQLRYISAADDIDKDFNLVAGEWTELVLPLFLLVADSDGAQVIVQTNTLTAWPVGATLDVDGVYFGKPGTYFDGDTPDDGQYRYAWAGVPHASTSTATSYGISAEPNAGRSCPYVGVTVEGLSVGEHRITIWRNSEGERVPVRGARNVPAVDSFFIEDYEAPLNRTVSYELEVLSGPDATTQYPMADVVLESDCGYIQDPLNPASAVPVRGSRKPGGEATLRPAAFASLAYEAKINNFQIQGDPRPVSIAGLRTAPSGIPIEMVVRAEAENVRLRDLVRQSAHLIIRPLPEWGSYLPGTATYAAPSITENPHPTIKTHTRWQTTGDIVRGSSARVLVALWRYQDVAEIFATYDQKQAAAAGKTYLDDQKNPSDTNGG